MKRLVLINPWSPDEEGVVWNFDYQRDYWRNPYSGLVQLASYVRRHGHQVKIIDAERDLLIEANGNPDLLLRIIESKVRYLRPDVVGVTSTTYRWPTAYRILRSLAALKVELNFQLILGGRHASAEPEQCFEDVPELDTLFYGFAELGLVSHLNGDKSKDVPGTFFPDEGQLKRTPQHTIEDLDQLCWPEWNLIDAPFYTHPNIRTHRSARTPLRSLDTICSRGCSRACAFCSGTDGKPKWHSVDYILAQILWTQRNFGINATIFQDTSLGNNPEFLDRLCVAILARGIQKNLIWTANMRANQVDEELMRLMYRSGCRLVFIGFESGSDRILKLMNKGCTLADNLRCAEILEQSQMPYWASFILGYPSETEDDVLATARLIEQIHPTTGWVNAFFPSPGSPIYRRLKRDGRIVVRRIEDWENFGRTGAGNSNLGIWAEMPTARFHYYLERLQNHFQAITERGLLRELEFSA